MSRSATIYGLPFGGLIFNPDFKAKRDEKGLWTGSNTFTCRRADLTRLIPQQGSSCTEEGFGFMGVISVDVANNEGDTATVTCNYSGTMTPDYTFGEDQPSIDYNSSLNVSTSEEPIETNPRYNPAGAGEGALSSEDRLIVAQFKAGRYKISETDEDGKIKTLITRIDDAKIGRIEITKDILKEILGKINDGIVSYLEPRQIYRYSIMQKVKPTSDQLNKVGKIGIPKEAPPVDTDRDWLLLGVNYDYNGVLYNVSEEWALSGKGGWDQELYGDN
jgi:hypothetical protein